MNLENRCMQCPHLLHHIYISYCICYKAPIDVPLLFLNWFNLVEFMAAKFGPEIQTNPAKIKRFKPRTHGRKFGACNQKRKYGIYKSPIRNKCKTSRLKDEIRILVSFDLFFLALNNCDHNGLL